MGNLKLILVAVITLVLLDGLWCRGCWDQERASLLQLKPFFDHLNWPMKGEESSDCCEWEMVKCNTSTGRVIELSLENTLWLWERPRWYLNASYFLPFEELTSLNLSGNGIVGCIENEGFEVWSSRLSNLEVLDLGDNSFDSSIISSLSEISSLKSLYLYENGMALPAPGNDFGRLSRLSNLELLDLGSNDLDFSIISSLSEISSLKSLYLYENGMALPAPGNDFGRLSRLRNLELLDLGSNSFDNKIISSLSALSSLRVLNLESNGLYGTIHAHEFNNLTNLKELDMGYNLIESFGSSQEFNNLTNLELLDLGSNDFDNKIISSLRALSSLRVLNLGQNRLNGTIHANEFKNLELLDLSYNSFDNKIISSLRALSSLRVLNLGGNRLNGTIHANEFNNLTNLKELNMGSNHIESFGSSQGVDGLLPLSNLEVLNLEYNYFDNSVLSSLRGLFHLKSLNLLRNQQMGGALHVRELEALQKLEELHLSDNKIENIVNPEGLCRLKNLQELYLNYNLLEGTLPQCLANLSSLRDLDVSHNNLTGNIASSPITNLLSIEFLSLGYNKFQVPISLHSFANHSNLKVLLCNECDLIVDSVRQTWTPKFQLQELSLSSSTPKKFKANLPDFLYYQYDLRSIDLSGNNFGGVFPLGLFENNTRLEEILMTNNSFVGLFPCPSHPNPNLFLMDISHNQLQGEIPSNASSVFPNLEVLALSKNSFQGNIQRSFYGMKSLIALDISQNNFSGAIPQQFVSPGSSLGSVKLSNNQFSGHVHPASFNSSELRVLQLDNNKLEGKIPDFSSIKYLEFLDISNNSFSGRIPRWMSELSNLHTIILSENHLEGPIPQELCKLNSLQFLDLSNNNFSGSIPPCFIQLTEMESVHLQKNMLSGPLPNAFRNFTMMKTLDLRDNNFSGSIPNWIGNLSNLGALLLKENHFHGEIPFELCELTQLSILDLSLNNFSGRLHPCLGNLTSEEKSPPERTFISNSSRPTKVIEVVLSRPTEVIEFVTKYISLAYSSSSILPLMYGIDLSSNQFCGEIPHQFGNLSRVKGLNLSHNNLIGPIPETFSNLKSMESLDLSYNQLTGRIPPQLTVLTSLEVFTVAYNNLSGPVPDRKAQFGTFDESSYEGNPRLCGPPLNNSCNGSVLPIPNEFPGEGDDDSFMDMFVFYVTFAVSYTVVLLGITTVLCINSYWRQMWFYHAELWITRCYYFVLDKFT